MSIEDRLLKQAVENTGAAMGRLNGLQAVPAGTVVLAAEFTEIRRELTLAAAAMQELERLAKGGQRPKIG